MKREPRGCNAQHGEIARGVLGDHLSRDGCAVNASACGSLSTRRTSDGGPQINGFQLTTFKFNFTYV
jgi:hypothetical protein